DEDGGSGISSCSGIVVPGSVPLASGQPLPTGTPGTYTLTVTATDVAGNTGSASRTYTVLPATAEDVLDGGGTVATPPPTPELPVQTALDAPPSVSGTITIAPSAAPAPEPAGFALFDQQVAITGPTTTSVAPYVVTFRVDATALGGTAPADVQVFRNGALV